MRNRESGRIHLGLLIAGLLLVCPGRYYKAQGPTAEEYVTRATHLVEAGNLKGAE